MRKCVSNLGGRDCFDRLEIKQEKKMTVSVCKTREKKDAEKKIGSMDDGHKGGTRYSADACIWRQGFLAKRFLTHNICRRDTFVMTK